MNKAEKIEEIRKRFDHEWLLIKVEQMDEATTTPLTGILLAHSPDPMEVHKIAMKYDGLLATIYSEDWPKDMAACFSWS